MKHTLTSFLFSWLVYNLASYLTSDLLTQTAGTAMTPLPPSLREPLSPSYWPQVRLHWSPCFRCASSGVDSMGSSPTKMDGSVMVNMKKEIKTQAVWCCVYAMLTWRYSSCGLFMLVWIETRIYIVLIKEMVFINSTILQPYSFHLLFLRRSLISESSINQTRAHEMRLLNRSKLLLFEALLVLQH